MPPCPSCGIMRASIAGPCTVCGHKPPTATPPPTPTGQSATRQTKPCPACGEQILLVAKKCKHCGESLDGSQRAPTGPAIELTSKRLKGRLVAAVALMGVGVLMIIVGSKNGVNAATALGALMTVVAVVLAIVTKVMIWWRHK